MGSSAARTISECLKAAPDASASADETRYWLFRQPKCVAVRLAEILSDDRVKYALSGIATQSWSHLLDPESKAQKIWQRLAVELDALATCENDVFDSPLPSGIPVAVFLERIIEIELHRKRTPRQIAQLCAGWCRAKLVIVADFIYPLREEMLPSDRAVGDFVASFRGRGHAADLPALGDFVAGMAINRLALMTYLCQHLIGISPSGKWSPPPEGPNWYRQSLRDLESVRDALWNGPHAEETHSALSLCQVYLTGKSFHCGYEPDWFVLPWPSILGKPSAFAIGLDDDIDIYRHPNRHAFWRDACIERLVRGAMDERPGEVVRIIRNGLEWLGSLIRRVRKQPPTGDGIKKKKLRFLPLHVLLRLRQLPAKSSKYREAKAKAYMYSLSGARTSAEVAAHISNEFEDRGIHWTAARARQVLGEVKRWLAGGLPSTISAKQHGEVKKIVGKLHKTYVPTGAIPKQVWLELVGELKGPNQFGDLPDQILLTLLETGDVRKAEAAGKRLLDEHRFRMDREDRGRDPDEEAWQPPSG